MLGHCFCTVSRKEQPNTKVLIFKVDVECFFNDIENDRKKDTFSFRLNSIFNILLIL